MTHATNAAPELESAREQHDQWRASRKSAVTSATGNLALVETRWFTTGTTLAEAEQLRAVARETAATSVGRTVTDVQRNNLSTGEPEFGLRIWDANSPAIQAFEQISTFDYNPEWVIEATFTPVHEDRTVPFEHIRDAGGSRELVVPGDITFERDGQTFTLSAFNDNGTLLLVFGDRTNGKHDQSGSYGAGRFLFVGRNADEFGHAGKVILDFNRAFVPPCGFSAQYNCPMPPAQNRLPWELTAGEQLPQFRNNFDIYAH